MAFNYVKRDESKLPKNLGVKGKNKDGIRYYTINGKNMPSVTSILGDLNRNIRSGFSYSGATELKQLHSNAEFVKQTTSGLNESNTHILARNW